MEKAYPNGPFHRSLNHENNSDPVNHPMNGTRMEPTPSEAEESSKLDHALLESLFYNEMMMLDDSAPSSSTLLSHFSEAAHPPASLEEPVSAVDAKTIAEKEMLRDFGVTSEPSWLHEPAAVKTAAAVVASAPPQSTHTPICPPPPAPLHPAAPVAPIAASKPPSASHLAPTNPPATKPALSIEPPPTAVSRERAQQLVDQFATLASRLGIALPTNVLQSLTAAAVKNHPQPIRMEEHEPTETDPSPTNPAQAQAEMKAKAEEVTSSSVVAPTVEELRKTAEEAIAAVTKKRPPDDQGQTISTNKPLYSKRRKKPRLSDCESRLAELKAENELLKRHLQNVSNKAHRFDQEKEEAGNRIGQLHMENAGPEEMAKAVKEFSDMYSDYGVNRQQELSFHLEQLQRLVNPTNFTKMGLWTLGRNVSNPKHNPIAGILKKELGISPQQGRKILDQSEKIRALCDNLKECLALLAKLKSLCEQKTRIFHDRMNKCTEILTTKQVVKLILWINEHTQLLETVCPGWGTEHIH